MDKRIKEIQGKTYIEYPVYKESDVDDFENHLDTIFQAFPFAKFPELLVCVVTNYEKPPGQRFFDRSGNRVRISLDQ